MRLRAGRGLAAIGLALRGTTLGGLAFGGLALAGPAIAADGVPIGGVKLVQPVTFPVISEFRVRVVVPPSEPNWRMQGGRSLDKHGLGSALVDFFPFDDHFHLSAGGRLYNRAGAKSSDPASLLLSTMRTPGGMRPGRKFTPTMLMGYSIDGQRGVALGIDAGVMMGRTNPGLNFRSGQGPHMRDGVNGLARMTMRLPF